MPAPFIQYVTRNPQWSLDPRTFPGNLPFVKDLHLEFDSPVTFFVGENGSGKSTLIEAIADLAGLPISGGSPNERGASHGPQEECELAKALRAAYEIHPRDSYFFRAELHAHFASLLDERSKDPDFGRDPYRRYGGASLHQMSHGEAFLSVMQNRIFDGLFLFDEPESALSPQRQLTLLALMYDRVERGWTQFIVATHSPILLTYPGATIISFDETPLERISLEETKHYQITRGILNSPESYWRHLRDAEE